MSESSLNRLVRVAFVACAVACVAWLWWLCAGNTRIPFLPASGPAEWIVAPKPPDPNSHRPVPVSAVFRKEFPVPQGSHPARLSLRTFGSAHIGLNGFSMDRGGAKDWKQVSTFDAGRFLRSGTNLILVTVTNSFGPPALWLRLSAPGLELLSGGDWEVSVAGSTWEKAVPATKPPPIREGSLLFGRETVLDSLRRCWAIGLVAILLACAASVLASRAVRTSNGTPAGIVGRFATPQTLLILLCVLWAALLANNLPQLAGLVGFDRDGHLQYIRYIQEKGALPLADEGWQMYQPPLYYLLGAGLMELLGTSTTADSGILDLRFLSGAIAIAHVLVLFLCLGVAYPGQPGNQSIGLLVGGLLPAGIYLGHNITNETLGALCVTAALYFVFRIQMASNPGRKLYLWAGICLGLAMLSKFSAVLVFPPVLAALALKHARKLSAATLASQVSRSGANRHFLISVVVLLVAALFVCGLHFGRVWWHFGQPLVGNWDAGVGAGWWQEPGFRTGLWFRRFGEVFSTPMFSSLSSFSDGIYSSLWGDGLGSGSARLAFRPQWNFNLMNLAYVLATVPTGLAIAGLVLLLVKFFRKPAAESLLVLGILFAFGFGIVYMTLRVPSYAQVKAFYGLSALVPFCISVITGFDWLACRGRVLRIVLWTLMLSWAGVSFAAFWIRPGAAYTPTARGISLADDARYDDALREFDRALSIQPSNLLANVEAADSLYRLKRFDEARARALQAIQSHPNRGEGHIQLGTILALEGNTDQAITNLENGLKLAPQQPHVHQRLAVCFQRQARYQDMVKICREGLTVNPYNYDLHYLLGRAWGQLSDITNSIAHFRLAVALKPESIDARTALGQALASSGQLDSAVAEFQELARLHPEDPGVYGLIGGARMMQRDTGRAIEAYREGLKLQPDNVELMNNLAWVLATAARPEFRNGAEAIRLAERACELTQSREPVLIGTLGAAYAEAGRFAEAITAAERARKLAAETGQKEVERRNAELMELYKSGKPCREPL